MAAAPRHQHGTPGKQAVHSGGVQLDGVPAQQILDSHLPQLLADGLLIDQLQGAGQGGHPDAPVRQLPQNFLSVQLVHGGDGKMAS